MAKIKRSQAESRPEGDKVSSSKEPVRDDVPADSATSESASVPGPKKESKADSTTEVQVHPIPLDPRDSTIRTLQLTLVVVSAIAIALLVALLVVVLRGGSAAPQAELTTPPATETTAAVPGGEATTAAPAPTYFTHYVPVNPDKVKEGAIIVEVHTDYQCPWCERMEDIYGEALYALSESGDIDLRVHLRTLVGDQIIKNDSSQRAAVAALCAQEVGSFWSYHSAIFANQPQEGVGYTDAQLRDQFASQAGITGEALSRFQTCYDTKQTTAEVTAAEQEGSAAGVNGTPTIFVNGAKVSFNLQSDVAHGQPVQKIPTADLLTGLQNL